MRAAPRIGHSHPSRASATVSRNKRFSGGYVMDQVSVDLQNCYGIKALKEVLDFKKTRAYALYAPNGVMKSSLAQTFADAANRVDSRDRIFPTGARFAR
jgi:hypothetical protein